MRLFPKRESSDSDLDIGDYLSIYDKKGNLVAQSVTVGKDEDIYLEYDGLLYMATISGSIYIEYNSLMNKFDN